MRSFRIDGSPPGPSGFTLLELSVVLALLGAILLTAIPRLSFFEETAFRSDARKVAALIRRLDDSSASGKSYYRLSFDIGGRTFVAEKSLNGEEFSIPDGMPSTIRAGSATVITGLAQNGSALTTGAGSVLFEPGHGAAPFSISLGSGSMKATISYNPYSGKVEII